MDRSKFQIVAVAAIGWILLGAVIMAVQLGAVAGAQEEADVDQTAVSGAASTLLQYQGRLSDPQTGEAVADGSYTMVLRLYKASSGGTPLWAEAKDVAVRDGLFSTVLGDTSKLDQALFNGQALWLGIKVGADDEASPRQQVLPVAYAMGLVPGAVIDGSLTVNGSLGGEHAEDTAAHHKRYTDAEAAGAALSHPEIVTQYEFDDHIYGGMHNGRAIAFGTINDDGSIASSTGNITVNWHNVGNFYEIAIDGHTYDWRSYVTVVTPVTGGISSAWSNSGKLYVGIYRDATSPGMKVPFHFVTFMP